MPIGSFSKYVSGFTSDHTYQAATISTETADHKTVVLSGLTWNLLNKCHSAATGGFQNNPFDLDETDAAYELRKRKQLKFLWRKIKKSDLDFIFLQEIDLFTAEPILPVVHKYKAALERAGWRIVQSAPNDNLKQAMATMYNVQKLELKDKKPVCKADSGKFTALEANFVHKPTGAPVCLTNMHLDFKTDHTNYIMAYQQEKIDQGIFTIIGGDTNPHTNVVYHNLIGDEDSLTSITNMEHPLRHDGFMASPANRGSRVNITEKECAYFKWVPTNFLIKMYRQKRGLEVPEGKFIVVKVDPQKAHLTHTEHISLQGMPWIHKAYEYLLSLRTGH